MKYTPLAHHKMMQDHILTRDVSVLWAEMGLGKTGSTLAAIAERIFETGKGALVVAPLLVSLLTWPDEIELWDEFRWMRTVSLRTKEGVEAWKKGTAEIYLINWEYLPTFIKQQMKGLKPGSKLPVDTVVYDELSKAKSHSSKRVNMWRRFRGYFDFHIGLTGTPSPNSYMDLFAQFRLMDGGEALGHSFIKFRRTYFDQADYMGYKWELKPGAKEQIEKAISHMVLTLKREDYLNIPPTQTIDVPVTLSAEVMAQYRKFEKTLLTEIKGQQIEALNAAALVNKLLQFTSGAIYSEDEVEVKPGMERKVAVVHTEKLKALKKLRSEHPKEPLLVATMFKHERARILKAFPEAELFSADRLEAWNRREIPMWVVDPRSVGHGLNLQRGGRIIVWVSQTYSRELYDQTNSRLARPGQGYETLIYRITAPMTVDDAVAFALKHKGSQQAGLFDAMKNLKILNKNAK